MIWCRRVILLKVKSQKISHHPIGYAKSSTSSPTGTKQTNLSHDASLTCDSLLTSLTSLPSSVMSLSRRLQNLSTSWSRSASALSIQLRTLLMDGPSVWQTSRGENDFKTCFSVSFTTNAIKSKIVRIWAYGSEKLAQKKIIHRSFWYFRISFATLFVKKKKFSNVQDCLYLDAGTKHCFDKNSSCLCRESMLWELDACQEFSYYLISIIID